MAYGRQVIMDGLRKAGTAFLDMDERYAKAFEDGLPTNPNVVQGFGGMGRSIPLRDHKGYFPVGSDYEFKGGHGPKEPGHYRRERIADNVILAANIASRYLLPAGGVTLAGKGLYDLTVGFGNEADETQPSQLPLY
tara:strand:- start:3382 stop:3789 length:408 start_codon:yes stop_codon:yes gene_type:complete